MSAGIIRPSASHAVPMSACHSGGVLCQRRHSGSAPQTGGRVDIPPIGGRQVTSSFTEVCCIIAPKGFFTMNKHHRCSCCPAFLQILHSHLELKQWPALLQWGVVALAPSLSGRRRLCCDWCQAIAGGWQEFTKLLQELRPVFAVVRLPLPEFLCLRAGLNSKRRPKQLTRSPSSCCKSGGDWLCLWTHASLSLHYVAWLCLASWSEWILSGLWALHVAVRTSHPDSRRPGLVKSPCALQLRAHLWQCVSPDNIVLFALTYCVIWFTYWSRLCRSPLSMHFSSQVYTQWLSVRHSGTVLLHPHELRTGHLCPWRTWPGRLICFVEFAFASNSFLLHLFECSCN